MSPTFQQDQCQGGKCDDLSQAGGEIAERLAAIPGMTVVEVQNRLEEYRTFELTYVQPVDHTQPDGPQFTQRARLLHRDVEAPMVLDISGYALFYPPSRLGEVAEVVQGNQLHVEHRFFDPSRPDPADWSKLTIRQAAGDHHRLVEALSPIYQASWLSTGVSKGGMASVYHRRFYPDDVVGTIAYVAPLYFGAPDPSIEPFYSRVGPAWCRDKLKAYQAELLARRDAMESRFAQMAAEEGESLAMSGGVEVAFEDSVVNYPGLFWLWARAPCEDLPSPSASDEELFSFHATFGGLEKYYDSSRIYYQPWVVQARTELGYGDPPFDHLGSAVLYEDAERPWKLLNGEELHHQPAVMEDIDAWVRSEGDRLIFIYGENDPHTAAAFELGGAVDSLKLTVPGGDHRASLRDLTGPDRAAVVDALSRWTGQSLRSTEIAPRPIGDRSWPLPSTKTFPGLGQY